MKRYYMYVLQLISILLVLVQSQIPIYISKREKKGMFSKQDSNLRSQLFFLVIHHPQKKTI